VLVTVGRYELYTQRADCVKGVSEWNEFLTQEFDYPVDDSMVPDICVYICVGKGTDLQPVCFHRIKAKDLIGQRFKAPPKWIFFKEDKSIDALDDGQFPGSVLIRLGFGTEEDATDSKQEWDESIQRMKRRSPYQVRCHLYQGRDLPAADSNGLLDPFLKINLLGQVKESTHKKKTRFPLYYETICFDCELPEREFLPQVNLQLYDSDMLKAEYMSMMFYNLQDAFVLNSLDDPLPDPEYRPLFVEGDILVSFQLIPKTRPDMVFPKPEPIMPSLRQAYIEIIALGIRNMKPYKFQDMVCPFLEMEMECVDKKVMIVTESSKRPGPSDPNFLQRLIMPVMLPDNALFATPMALRARDTRLGGYMKPEVGVGVVDLVDKIPWSKTYRPPQTDIFFQDSLNMAAGFVAGSAEESKDAAAPLDAAAKAAIEMQEKRTAQVQEDEFILTQEPLDLESFIKQRINEDDIGAGVFGALTHLELPEYGGKRKKTAEDFFTEIDFDEVEVDEPPKYMVNRTVLDHELEEEFKTTPFETYQLTRGQANHPVLGNTLKVVGRFKGLVRVMLSEDEAPLFDLDQLLKPQGYKIRLYVLRGTNLTPMDVGFGGRPGKSDPYLTVKLGKDLFDDRENA
ncbi:Dysf, partial [Symbiodinium microadriaticum]